MSIFWTNIFQVANRITFDMLPGGCIVSAEVDVVGEQVAGQNGLEVQEDESDCIEVKPTRIGLYSELVHMDFISHLVGEDNQDLAHVPHEGEEKEQVKAVVELSDADVHEHAMVVILVHAGLALVAMPHSHPLRQVALQTPLLEFG